MLYFPSDFIDVGLPIAELPPAYWYHGEGLGQRLPRTAFSEAIARGLMRQLAKDDRYSCEGKMYGILLVETPEGVRVLKAFSGLFNGSDLAGWVPASRHPIVEEEARTLAALEELKQELARLQELPVRGQYTELAQAFAERFQALAQQHQQSQQTRQQQRQLLSSELTDELTDEALAIALTQLDEQSRREGITRRRLKQERDAALLPLKQAIEQADAQMRSLRQQRKLLSRSLQAQLHSVYRLTNFAGESIVLQQLSRALPTGTGECCAPKLLNYAARYALKPLAMAEFWWGVPSANGDRVPGEFYGACPDRCQPLMGFLLSGLLPVEPLSSSQSLVDAKPQEADFEGRKVPLKTSLSKTSLPKTSILEGNRLDDLLILYEDEWLIAVNKPAGLLSVPGRTIDRQDSVLSRLRCALSDEIAIVHRLDQDTSGILLLARDAQTQRHLGQQFQQQQVCKIYEAILTEAIAAAQGTIDLPLWADPSDRPYQKVDWQRGKPSLTHFQVIERAATSTRIRFIPASGRTHQLRVHAADQQGLASPILGDRLYGKPSSRLHLHAKELQFRHPQSGEMIVLQTDAPF